MNRTVLGLVSLVLILSLGVVAVRSLRGPADEDESRVSEVAVRARNPADLPVLQLGSAEPRVDASERESSSEAPVPNAAATIAPVSRGLLDLSDMELFEALADKIAGGDEADREEVLAAVRAWLKNHDMHRFRWAVHALIVHGDPDHALADLLDCGHTVARDFESEGKNPSTLFSTIGIHVSNTIDENLPKPERERMPAFAREGFVQAMVRSGLFPEEEDRVHFLAVALGGSDDGHPDAIRFLTEMAGAYEDASLRELAAVNLGRVGRVSDLLLLGESTLARPPTDEREQRLASGVLCGIYNATANHPEELAESLPIFEDVLLGWTEGPLQNAARLEILGWLSSMQSPELEGLFRQLSEDPTSEGVRRRAGEALEKLDDASDE